MRLGFFAHGAVSFVCDIIGIFFLLILWYFRPDIVQDIVNFNERLIEWGCGLVTDETLAARIESGLDVLQAENMLLLVEFGAAVKFFTVFLFRFFRIGHRKKLKAA